jgi:transcriptional regulator with XRE-family HTH domain
LRARALSGGSYLAKMNIREVLAINLIKIREKKRWTQEQVSWESGLSRTFISDIETQKKSPTVDRLAALANTLEVPVQILLTPDGHTLI